MNYSDFKNDKYPLFSGIVIKKQIWEKAKPFAHLWMSINGEKELIGLNQKETLVPVSVFCEYGDLFKYLHFGTSDYIMIDGLSNTDRRLRGLLCIEADRKMADEDNCFFIGDMFEGLNNQRVLLNARQIREYLGINAKYMVCKVKMVNKEEAQKESLAAFAKLSGEFLEDEQEW